MFLATILSTGDDGRWHPGFGDPSIVGWVTVLAYFAAGLLALRAAARSRPAFPFDHSPEARDGRTVARFWGVVALCMLALGVNKQLDLQTLFTEVLRDLAIAQGWYHGRRPLQIAFIVAIALGGAAGLAFALYLLRHVARRVLGGAIGLVLITTFVIVRAASFHHVDMLLGRGTIRLNWVLELSGIAVVAIAAMRVRGRALRAAGLRESRELS